VADHIDHIRQVAGIDSIGIGADYSDVKPESMVEGLGDVSRYPHLFAELLRRGYSDEDVLKIAGRNLQIRSYRGSQTPSASPGEIPPFRNRVFQLALPSGFCLQCKLESRCY